MIIEEQIKMPIKGKYDVVVYAELMDLDGTSVQSEEFWMWVIQENRRLLLLRRVLRSF